MAIGTEETSSAARRVAVTVTVSIPLLLACGV
jgi:hypothetical protein